MLRITIELVPGGDETRKRHLGTAEIINDASGNIDLGNYTVRLSRMGNPTATWRCGRVKGFRRQVYGPWDLLYLAIGAALGALRRSTIVRNTGLSQQLVSQVVSVMRKGKTSKRSAPVDDVGAALHTYMRGILLEERRQAPLEGGAVRLRRLGRTEEERL